MNELALLGKKCRDQVTGFEGICTSVIEWLYGCQQFVLQPKTKDPEKREKSGMFFEKQLEVLDDDGLKDVEIPEYTAPDMFGKECFDKVTKQHGICIGRAISLFSCTQYVLEHQPVDPDKDSRMIWLDEGRLEIIPESDNSVNPEEVRGSKPGGILEDVIGLRPCSAEQALCVQDHPIR